MHRGLSVLEMLGPLLPQSLSLGLDADFYRLFIPKWPLNCCGIQFLIHEEKEETHPKMSYFNKIFKVSNKIFFKFGISMATLPAELLLGKEAVCFNEPTGSLLQPAHVCLALSWLPGVNTWKQFDGAGVWLSRLWKFILLLWQFFPDKWRDILSVSVPGWISWAVTGLKQEPESNPEPSWYDTELFTAQSHTTAAVTTTSVKGDFRVHKIVIKKTKVIIKIGSIIKMKI